MVHFFLHLFSFFIAVVVLALLASCGVAELKWEETRPEPVEQTISPCSDNHITLSTGPTTITDNYQGWYSVLPEAETCQAGVLNEEVQQAALGRLNAIRALHDLPAVTYDAGSDTETAQASLLLAANQELTHHPGTDMQCYSENAGIGCGSSNIGGGVGINVGPLGDIDGWINDSHNLDPGIGHRRWLLFPMLASISYGRADFGSGIYHASAIKVINDKTQSAEHMAHDFVAFPFKCYPAHLVSLDFYLSFSVVADKTQPWGANADVSFENASISVVDAEENTLNVTDVTSNNVGYGIPNVILWKAEGLERNVRYHVVISNVDVEGERKDFDYWFELLSSS